MSAPKAGRKIGKAGASPLRAEAEKQAAPRQEEIVTAPQAAQEEIVTKPGENMSKAEIEQAPTQAMTSSNPPPPSAVVIPKPPATPSTADFIAATQEPVKPSEPNKPRQVDSQIITGDVPISVETPQVTTPPSATPPSVTGPIEPPKGVKTFFGSASLPTGPQQLPPRRAQRPVLMMTLSQFTPEGRLRNELKALWARFKALPKWAIILIPLLAIALGASLPAGVYYGLRAIMADAPTAEAAEPTLPTAPLETVVVAEPEPPVIAPVPEPEPEPVPTEEPGFRGRRRAIARDAFPVSCLTAGTIAHASAHFLCGPGQRDGANLCNCTVVPRH